MGPGGGLHIGVAGPIACDELRDLLNDPQQTLPVGYGGAPLMSVLIRELLNRGYRVSAFTTSNDLSPANTFEAKGRDLKLVVVPARLHAWRPNGFRPGRIVDGFAMERRALVSAMRCSAPDLVHAHWSYEFALAALASKLPTLVTCHDASREVLRHTRSPYRFIRHLMARRVLSRALHVTAVSPYMRSMIECQLEHDVAVVPNPIAPYVSKQSSCRQRPATRRIAMVCNGWDRRKNPEAGLRAFSIFRQSVPCAELHLFGAAFGPGLPGERWARAAGLDDGVTFVGPVPHKDLIVRLHAMDVLLHPALEESFGVVVAEAMALGLPVVAGQESGAVPWVLGLDDECEASSLLCNVGDAGSIASMLTRAFSEDYSAISASGVDRAVMLFSSQAIVDAYVARYESVVSAKKGV